MSNENAKKDCKDCLHYESCKGTYASAKGGESLWHDFDAEMYAYCGCEDFQHKDLVKRTKYESKKYRNIYQAVKEEVTRLHDKVRCQRAEIESLKQIIDEYPVKTLFGENNLICSKTSADYEKLIMDISNNAIKKFAQRLKKINSTMDKRIISVKSIDNLVKEMTEVRE